MKTLRTTRDIVIPAGTVFDLAPSNMAGPGYVSAVIGHGKDFASWLTVQDHPDAIASGDFEESS